MLDTLIRNGYSWTDLNEMTQEDLYDLINAKAELKKARQRKNERGQQNEGTLSLEDFIKKL
ncbi:MAG TPA: hypothetical protein IAC14_15560 [Candidatus Scybalomonas excrementigallinarum]|nr:hypothetical protein [Candidatus Scybalomonas excrementigallinarum]